MPAESQCGLPEIVKRATVVVLPERRGGETVRRRDSEGKSMPSVYFRSQLTDKERRTRLYCGDLFILPATAGTEALMSLAKRMLEDPPLTVRTLGACRAATGSIVMAYNRSRSRATAAVQQVTQMSHRAKLR